MQFIKSKNQQIMILGSLAIERDSFFRIFLLAICFCLSSLSLCSQGVSGVVTESFSHHPIQNATVKISFKDHTDFECTTNAMGQYHWQMNKAGRAIIEITADGFQSSVVTDLLFDGYTTVELSYTLEKIAFDLEGIMVVASQNNFTPFVRTITPDDALRIAGNFEDPVRIAHSEPGIVLLNDQANHLSARGQSPLFNSWYLEGLTIVNPNHTSNAGTLSDLPTQYGGGVNMFSAQTLGSTEVYMGVNPMSVNTNSGAAIDMHLHETAKPEWRAKAGLLGFELGGGTAIGHHSMLDFNLRYSFTGILTSLGADFGGEKINYYDGVVSFRNEGEKHKLKLFTWAGRSTNIFEHVEPSEDRETYKDFFDIDYGNDILGVGGRYDLTIAPKLFFKSGIAYSEIKASYLKNGPFDTIPSLVDRNYITGIISAFAEMTIQHTQKIHSNIGTDVTHKTYRIDNNESSYDEENSSIRPYINTFITFAPKWNLELGGECQYNSDNQEWVPGYRFQLNWNLSGSNLLFAGMRHAPNLPFYESESAGKFVYVVSDAYEIGWKYARAKHKVGLNLYSQRMEGLITYPFTSNPNSQNDYEYMADYPNAQYAGILGSGRNGASHQIGVEGQWEYTSSNEWALNVNQSVYKSVRGLEDSELASGRYNGKFTTHFSIAKEVLKAGDKNKFWNFSMRGIYNGGLWEPTFNTQINVPPYYAYPVIYNQRIPNYFRIDVGITRTIARAKVRWRYSLDIQNVFGITNVAYHYYDPYLDQIVPQNQLGLIPVLSVQASW